MASSYPSHGALCKVKIGADEMSNLKSWNLTEEAGTASADIAGATTPIVLGSGIIARNITASALFDNGDTVQAALTAGASVTLLLYVDGDTTGNDEWSCPAIVQNRSFGPDVSGISEINWSFIVTGAITEGTA